MTGVEEHMAALGAVKDILAEYEDMSWYGIEWEPVNWDLDHDDMNAVVEYYNALIEARNELVTADNADFLMSSDIYEHINTTINEISDSVEKYTQQQYNALKLNYEWQNGIPTTKEEFESMERSILAASGAGQAFQGILKGYLTEDFSSLATDIENVDNAVREAAGEEKPITHTLSLSQTIDQLNTQLKPAMDSLKSAWQEIFTDDGGFELNSIDIISTCDAIKSKLDELNGIEGIDVDYSAFDGFIDVLNDSEATADEVKESFNRLATSIAQAGISGAEDFETLKAALEDLGVINEELVAFDALISNTEALKVAGLDLASATDEQIAAFANETVSAENVSQAIAMLTFQKELCAIQDMNVTNSTSAESLLRDLESLNVKKFQMNW